MNGVPPSTIPDDPNQHDENITPFTRNISNLPTDLLERLFKTVVMEYGEVKKI